MAFIVSIWFFLKYSAAVHYDNEVIASAHAKKSKLKEFISFA